MRQYVVDEIRPADHAKVKVYLDALFQVPGYEGLYHLPLDKYVLSDLQRNHDQCRPHYFALELLPDRLSCEFLVRTNHRVRCDCIQYATPEQQRWLMDVVDALFEDLEIIT